MVANGALLELDDIHTYYGESYVLQGVSLKAQEGSVVALLGRNGMGKTTTIRSIVGFTPPRRGDIRLRGRTISGLQPFQIVGLGVGLIPQGRRIFPSLSVEENLRVAMRASKGARSWTLERVYDRFPILKERARNRGTSLSGGEQQMLAISRALLTNAELLLLDEPSEGLAPLVVRNIAEIMEELKTEGLSMLLVEQNIALATRLADYVYVISDGRIIWEGDTAAFLANRYVQEQHIGVAAEQEVGRETDPA
ncbi:MAG: ABC transporter ATP-binding protein [Thermoleophilia bacterium]|nr:ABC transporter ATP-binding protein [Thermoleophilia bacterium]